MTARLRISIFTILILLLTSLAAQPFQQITDDGSWSFPETNHTVSGEFLEFYKQTDDYFNRLWITNHRGSRSSRLS